MHAVFLPRFVKLPLSEDFSNKNAFLEILSTTFMQFVLSADKIFNLNTVFVKWHVY